MVEKFSDVKDKKGVDIVYQKLFNPTNSLSLKVFKPKKFLTLKNFPALKIF